MRRILPSFRLITSCACAVVPFLAFACSQSPRPKSPNDAKTSPAEPSRDAVPAATPAPGAMPSRRVWLEPPTVVGRVFFADELHPLVDAIASALPTATNGDVEVVAPQQLRDLQRDLRAGKVPGVEGRCEVVAPPALLYQHLNRDVTRVDVRVECESSCALKVELESPRADDPSHGDERLRWSAALPKDGSVDDWARVVREQGLTRVTKRPAYAGGLGILTGHTSGLAKGQYDVRVRSLRAEGSWPRPLSDDLLKSHARALYECEKSGGPRRDTWLQPFVVEVGADGKVERCESKYQHRLDAPGLACRCGVFSKLNFGKGDPGRRAEFDIRVDRGGSLNPSGRGTTVTLKIDSDDPSAAYAGGSPDRERLQQCLLLVPGAARVDVTFHIVVGADGTVTAHDAPWPATLPGKARACLDDALEAARFSCPLSGKANVTGALTLSIQ